MAVSRILENIVLKESPNLVLIGKQSIDDDSNQVAQMLAGRLGWPQTFASQINFNDNKGMQYIFISYIYFEISLFLLNRRKY